MRTIELFSGTKSFSNVMTSHGHDTFTIDNISKLAPDLVADIFDVNYLPSSDMLWASPPCTTFSVASICHYWIEGKPRSLKTLQGLAILEKTVKLIAQSKPAWWFIENPRGMMRKNIDSIFDKYGIEQTRNTVSYCQYGSKIMKPTDIWTNAYWWEPRTICKPGAECHERAGRGSKTGVQGIYNLEWERERGNSATARGVVPQALFEEILNQLP